MGVVVTAPGKLILAGEHSAVYGGAALVATLGLTVRVEAGRAGRDAEAAAVRVDLRDLGVVLHESWAALVGYAERARAAWELYAASPGPASFRAVRGSDPAHLVKVALGELAADRGGPAGLPALDLAVSSEIPIGSGFGSSAALAVAIPAAALAALGGEPSVELLARLGLEIERRQHGTPSGADHNAVLRGGVVRVEPAGGGGVSVQPLHPLPAVLERLSVYDTGAPAESTGEVVAAVRALRDREPLAFEDRLRRMGEAVDTIAVELTGGASSQSSAERGVERLGHAIRAFERCLEELGVVPPSLSAWIRRIESRGAAAKVCGAGALSEGGAGSLLVYRGPACGRLARELAGIAHYPVALGVQGLTVEGNG